MSELEIGTDDLTPDTPPDAVNDLGRISELLGRDAPEQTTDDSDSSPDEPLAADTAEQETDDADDLELVVDEDEQAPVKIDYDLVIPMPGGDEPVTVGQLKDFYQGKIEFDQQRETWEANRIEQDTKHIVAKQTLSELAQMMADVDPKVATYLAQQQSEHRKAEATKLLEVFPEWRDPEVKRAATPALRQAATKLGFTESEFAMISDHRQIRALQLLARYMSKEDAAKAALEANRAKLPKGQKAPQRKISAAQEKRNKIERAKHGSQADKTAAISALLNGA